MVSLKKELKLLLIQAKICAQISFSLICTTVHSLWLERLGRLKNRSTSRAFHLEGVGLMEKVQMGPSNIVPAEGVPGQRAFQRRECTVFKNQND